MFAALAIEKDPFRWQDVPAGLEAWVQSAGGYALAGALLWLAFGLPFLRSGERARIPGWQTLLFVLGVVGALAAYAGLLVLRFEDVKNFFVPPTDRPLGQAPVIPPLSDRERLLLTAGGACALLAVAVPFLRGLLSLRGRRIFALAKLSFKEALRRRVLYAFSALLLVFLFGTWFVAPSAKPEDELRTYVQLVFYAMGFLLIPAAAFLAGFSIPTDIRQLTIHTVVTKPVEKFEIVLGRFLGFMALMTLVLAVMTTLSLLYVLRGVGPDAAAESLKARVPVYGDLYFVNTEGESVGREWDYRKYISAPNPGQEARAATACWGFAPPAGLGQGRDRVRCEFTFDIYRTTKGEENRGISVFLTFHGGPYDPARENEYRQEREALRRAGQPEAQIDAALAEKYGFYEVPSKSISDYHTQALDVPAALFRYAANAPAPAAAADPRDLPLQVRVRCNSRTQYIGMAKYDLYFRADDPTSGADTPLFAANFYKGAVGLWLRLCLVTGVAVAMSTYFTGVISMLLAVMLVLAGGTRDFIQQVAYGTNVGGGPTEALYRLVGNKHISAPLEVSTTKKVAEYSDAILRFVIRRVLDVVPDVDRYDFTAFVAEGFNVSAAQLALNTLLLAGYLLPWFVLAYFIMKWREIATW